ncbi:MAG: FkbM family methyltransferase [Actinobacteria bacterium]|nr:MAG: FkbM family methyltransferase [Actinomycetota bacterium]
MARGRHRSRAAAVARAAVLPPRPSALRPRRRCHCRRSRRSRGRRRQGDDRFFALLARNAAQLEPIELEHAFVETPARGRIERGAGTARVVEGGGPIRAKPLRRILDEHPRFARPALLKLDTDGFDVPILLANLDLLARTRPVLFFEYDPYLGATPDVFERLREIGYRRLDVYENTGEHVRSLELPGDIHGEYVGHRGARYADVCIRP